MEAAVEKRVCVCVCVCVVCVCVCVCVSLAGAVSDLQAWTYTILDCQMALCARNTSFFIFHVLRSFWRGHMPRSVWNGGLTESTASVHYLHRVLELRSRNVKIK